MINTKLTKSNMVFLSLIALLIVFAVWDSVQIKTMYEIEDTNKWDLYNQFAGPSFYVAVLVIFAIIGVVVYYLTKDKGLGIGAFAAGYILFVSGVEDLAFFIFGTQEMTACMSWFDESGHVVSKVAEVLGHDCASPIALIISSILGVIIAYYVFEYLRKKY